MVANAIARADSPRGSPVGRAGSLIDTLGRRIHHLRLSVTSACDLHCVYCRPRASGAAGRGLTDAKRLELVQFMHRQYGLTHVRITGGEPLLHVGVVGLIQSLRTKVPELSLAMTTNGQRLTE